MGREGGNSMMMVMVMMIMRIMMIKMMITIMITMMIAMMVMVMITTRTMMMIIMMFTSFGIVKLSRVRWGGGIAGCLCGVFDDDCLPLSHHHP